MSTAEQSLNLQLDALRAAGVHEDNLHSEFKSATAAYRPAFEAAMKDLRSGDTLVVWRLDRLARRMRDILTHTNTLKEKGCGFRSLTENFDTTTPGGTLVFHFIAGMAQFESDVTVARTKAGMASAKKRGVSFGRKHVMTPALVKRAMALLRQKKHSVRTVADALGVAPQTLYNAKISKRRALARS